MPPIPAWQAMSVDPQPLGQLGPSYSGPAAPGRGYGPPPGAAAEAPPGPFTTTSELPPVPRVLAEPCQELPLGHPQRPLPCAFPASQSMPLPGRYAGPPLAPGRPASLAQLAVAQEAPQWWGTGPSSGSGSGREGRRVPRGTPSHLTLLDAIQACQPGALSSGGGSLSRGFPSPRQQPPPRLGLASSTAAGPSGPPPGKVVKTLATLPDVQLLYQSSPGPRGVALSHTLPGLTCSLQLVRLPPPRPGPGAGAGAGGQLLVRASLLDEVRDVVVTFRDNVQPGGPALPQPCSGGGL